MHASSSVRGGRRGRGRACRRRRKLGQCSQSVPAGVDPGTLLTELFDPTRPGTIVDYQFGHLWLSRDTGATWTQAPQVLASAPTGFDGAGDLYAIGRRVRVSHDDGLNWSTRR